LTNQQLSVLVVFEAVVRAPLHRVWEGPEETLTGSSPVCMVCLKRRQERVEQPGVHERRSWSCNWKLYEWRDWKGPLLQFDL